MNFEKVSPIEEGVSNVLRFLFGAIVAVGTFFFDYKAALLIDNGEFNAIQNSTIFFSILSITVWAIVVLHDAFKED